MTHAFELRARARQALKAIGADVRLGKPGGLGLPASTPITGEVLFTVAQTTAEQADQAIAAAAQAFSAWRSTPAPVRGALVSRLGETGHLGVLEGTEAVTVAVVDGWQTVRMHSWVGKRSPAHCSSMGKALLAELSPAELAAICLGARTGFRTASARSRTGHIRPSRIAQRQIQPCRRQGELA